MTSKVLARKPSGSPSPHREPADAVRGKRLAPAIVHDVLASPGRPLDRAARERFEPTLGHSFSRVRIHDDARAARSADAVDARGYAVGEHVVLGATGRDDGERTLAHELAHAAQQRATAPKTLPGELPIGDPDSAGEAAARDAVRAALAGRRVSVAAETAAPVLRRQPRTDPKTPETTGSADQGKAGGTAAEEDDPTPWLTLQAQGLAQYARIYTIPQPPPWLIGAQLAANFQFHRGKTGFELALVGQYGRVLTLGSSAVAPGDQGQIALQPSWLIVNTGGSQLALFGQGGYGSTSSKDPSVAGQQFSLLGGLQGTQDLVSLGPVKVQGVASLSGGGVWAKGPADDRFSPSGTWQVAMGLQLSWDAVKRKKRPPLPPPPAQSEVRLPDADDPRKTATDAKKDPGGAPKPEDESRRKADDEARKKVADEAKTADGPTATKPPLPADATVFFLQDRPAKGLPDDDGSVLAGGWGGADPKALESAAATALAADPATRVTLFGFASIEGPGAEYNCRLGTRRADWLRARLGIDRTRVADPTDQAALAGSCQDDGGIVSFGSTRAADTKVESERRRDRFAVVHFHRR